MMPVFNSKQLLAELELNVQHCLAEAASWQQYTDEAMRQTPNNGGWSRVEVVDHLNFYANFYASAIANAMKKKKSTSKETFKSGWLGDYFTRIIGPAPAGKVLKQKMKSPANAVPMAPLTLDPQKVLNQYIAYQHELRQLLQQAQLMDLGKIRVPISLTTLIKLKLGDTFRFVVAHQLRHHQQIARLALEQ